MEDYVLSFGDQDDDYEVNLTEMARRGYEGALTSLFMQEYENPEEFDDETRRGLENDENFDDYYELLTEERTLIELNDEVIETLSGDFSNV